MTHHATENTGAPALDRPPLAWAPDLPMVLSEVEVAATTRLTPTFVRLELAGPGLAEVGLPDDAGDPVWWDQRFKLVVPDPTTGAITSVDDADGTWLSTWMDRPVTERGHMRTYTVRELRGSGRETRLVFDVVLHEGASGPGADWATNAQVGDRAVVLLPRRGHPFGGIEFVPGDATRLLLVGDETAVPAVCSILETLPDDARGLAVLEVPVADDVLPVRHPAGVEVRWLPRGGRPRGEAAQEVVYAHLGADFEPDLEVSDEEVDPELWETPSYSSSGEEVEAAVPEAPSQYADLYAWIAGESSTVTALRRHMVRDLGIDRRQVSFMGYWRLGVSMKS